MCCHEHKIDSCGCMKIYHLMDEGGACIDKAILCRLEKLRENEEKCCCKEQERKPDRHDEHKYDCFDEKKPEKKHDCKCGCQCREPEPCCKPEKPCKVEKDNCDCKKEERPAEKCEWKQSDCWCYPTKRD